MGYLPKIIKTFIKSFYQYHQHSQTKYMASEPMSGFRIAWIVQFGMLVILTCVLVKKGGIRK